MKKKFRLSLFMSKKVHKALTAGVLASVLSFNIASPVFAEIRWGTHMGEYNHMEVIGYDDVTGYLYYGQGNTGDEGSLYLGVINGGVSINGLSVNGRTITYTKTDGTTGTITTQDTDTTYSAGYGVSLSGTTFSAKAGTNVTVNSNGISVTGNGTVASGNTGLIDGGKLYTEVRPSDNGNYVKLLKIQYNESFCHTKPPGLCPSLKKQAVLFFLRPVHERAV